MQNLSKNLTKWPKNYKTICSHLTIQNYDKLANQMKDIQSIDCLKEIPIEFDKFKIEDEKWREIWKQYVEKGVKEWVEVSRKYKLNCELLPVKYQHLVTEPHKLISELEKDIKEDNQLIGRLREEIEKVNLIELNELLKSKNQEEPSIQSDQQKGQEPSVDTQTTDAHKTSEKGIYIFGAILGLCALLVIILIFRT